MAFLLTERYLLGFQASHVDTRNCSLKEVGLFPPMHIYVRAKKKKRQSFQNICSLVPL